MGENPKDAQNRRILRRSDPPQNLEDAAALKLLSVFERIPQLEILRLTVFTANPKGRQHHRGTTQTKREIMLLELLKRADDPLGGTRELYLRVEFALAEVLRRPVEELAAAAVSGDPHQPSHGPSA